MEQTKSAFLITVGGNRTTEQVVAAGKYQYANSWAGGGYRELDLDWAGHRWGSGTLVSGVRNL